MESLLYSVLFSFYSSIFPPFCCWFYCCCCCCCWHLRTSSSFTFGTFGSTSIPIHSIFCFYSLMSHSGVLWCFVPSILSNCSPPSTTSPWSSCSSSFIGDNICYWLRTIYIVYNARVCGGRAKKRARAQTCTHIDEMAMSHSFCWLNNCGFREQYWMPTTFQPTIFMNWLRSLVFWLFHLPMSIDFPLSFHIEPEIFKSGSTARRWHEKKNQQLSESSGIDEWGIRTRIRTITKFRRFSHSSNTECSHGGLYNSHWARSIPPNGRWIEQYY